MFKIVFSPSIKFYQSLVIKRNAGHSKWQNIRHTKASKDTQRSLLFAKIGRQMKVAIQGAEGGTTDADQNIRLRNAIEQAKRISMPQATIQSIIKSTQNDKSNCKMHLLEIKGPGNCVILLEVFTDKLHSFKQTLASVLRKNLSKYSDGSGIHLFDEKGIIETEILTENQTKPENELIELATDHAIEAGAEDVQILEGSERKLQFFCGATSLKQVTGGLEKLNYTISSASVEYVPIKMQELNENELRACSNLFDKLENLPETVRISDNIA